MPACTQCRQRKVRCSGGTNSCEACVRLGFKCSLDDLPSPITPHAERSTAAPRRRGGRACDQCRAHKIRCARSDTTNCFRCQQNDQLCTYSLSIRQYRAQHQRTRVNASSPGNLPAGLGDVDSGISPATYATFGSSGFARSADDVLGCDTVVARQHIDAFFEFVYPIPVYSFLHRANVLRQYSTGSLAPAILLAICGAASRFLSSSKEAAERARVWIDTAETKVFKSLGEAKPYHAEALMILGYYRRCNHQSGKAFFYVSLAARMVFHLRLHKEDRNLSFLEQERRRRLVWCIFTVDRFCAGGVQEYLVLPVASIHVQLPCHERYFETDTAVKTSFLHERDKTSEQSLSAVTLRIFDIRNRVLQYAKAHLESSTSPELSIAQFKRFEYEFQDVHDSLSAELRFSVHTFELRAFSPERTPFVIFHVYYHHCHCELYRLLNPGYREALQESVINSTNPELVAYAQLRCLQHATAIGELIATTYKLVGNELYVSDAAIFVMLYQASCAILYACHRDSPAFAMSPTKAQHYFTIFVDTLARLLRYFPKFSIYVEDIRNMLRSIMEPNAPLPRQKAAVEVDFRARPVPGGERSDGDDSEPPSVVRQNEPPKLGSPSCVNSNNSIPPGALINPSLPADQGVGLPVDSEDLFWPFLGTLDSSTDPISDPSHGLLWDWADALGPINSR